MSKRIIALIIICAIAVIVFVFGRDALNMKTDAVTAEEQAQTENPEVPSMQAEQSSTITIDEDSEGSLTP